MPNSSIITTVRTLFSGVPGLPSRTKKSPVMADKPAALENELKASNDNLAAAPTAPLSRHSTVRMAPSAVIQEPEARRSVSLSSASVSPTLSPPPFVELSHEQVAAKMRQARRRLGVGIQIWTIDQNTVDDLNTIIGQQPLNIEALALRALAYRVRKNPRGCVADCDRILALDPQNRFALLHRAAAYSYWDAPLYKKEETRDAIQKGILWASQHPEDRFGVFISCLYLTGTEDYKRAESALMDVLAKNPHDECAATVMLALYDWWWRRGGDQRLVDASIELGKKVLSINPKNPTANLIVGPKERILKLGLQPRYDGLSTDLCPGLFVGFPLSVQDDALAAMLRLNETSTSGT